jgi:hypothetical protein
VYEKEKIDPDGNGKMRTLQESVGYTKNDNLIPNVPPTS